VIQPTKGVSVDRALLTVGAQVVRQLDHPLTVSAVWHAVKVWRQQVGYQDNLPYSWFVLALDALFTLGAVRYEDGLLVKVGANASQPV
jgi:hypothetical protein